MHTADPFADELPSAGAYRLAAPGAITRYYQGSNRSMSARSIWLAFEDLLSHNGRISGRNVRTWNCVHPRDACAGARLCVCPVASRCSIETAGRIALFSHSLQASDDTYFTRCPREYRHFRLELRLTLCGLGKSRRREFDVGMSPAATCCCRPIYIGRTDVTESVVTRRSPFCGFNTK